MKKNHLKITKTISALGGVEDRRWDSESNPDCLRLRRAVVTVAAEVVAFCEATPIWGKKVVSTIPRRAVEATFFQEKFNHEGFSFTPLDGGDYDRDEFERAYKSAKRYAKSIGEPISAVALSMTPDNTGNPCTVVQHSSLGDWKCQPPHPQGREGVLEILRARREICTVEQREAQAATMEWIDANAAIVEAEHGPASAIVYRMRRLRENDMWASIHTRSLENLVERADRNVRAFHGYSPEFQTVPDIGHAIKLVDLADKAGLLDLFESVTR